jgi:DNA-binding SARP family transcriptional activator
LLTVGVLGQLIVSVGDRPIQVAAGRQRTLLAVLAMAAGQPISVDRLVSALWGNQLPANARRAVQKHLGRLRGALGYEVIDTAGTGYLLRAEPDQVDALRFGRLLDAAARLAGTPAERDRLAEALALWRGSPFDGMGSEWLERTEAPRLTERYLAAVERRIDLDLPDGDCAALVAELRELTALHPLRESLWVRLVRALASGGRQAEALAQYEVVRRNLADQLGADPGPELRRIHADLLASPPASRRLATAPASVRAAADPVSMPRQLPAGIAGFAGRAEALAALDGLASESTGGPAVVISAIAGTAGVGKTALALHWAHRSVDRFPDGQLYANLRGFHPSGQAMTPAEAVRGFLDALGMPPSRVPSALDDQAALYRSLLAGRRMLVLLDNARDADQVRPLLPGAPGCLVVVTSRNQLTSLVATEAARPLALDLPTVQEARELLARRLGAERIAGEPAAVDEIIRRCARLPLALAVTAARAAIQPGLSLQAVAGRLDAERSQLDAFTAHDPNADARAAFSWSYRTLDPDTARLFRLLGLHPGPDLSAPAAASLAGVAVPGARAMLAELVAAHLVTEHAAGRYSCHDLLRAYAVELGEQRDSGSARRGALRRLFDHYLHTVHAASLALHPYRESIALPVPAPGASVERFPDQAAASAWLTAEQPALLAAVRRAADAGFDTHAWQLPAVLGLHLERRGYWRDWVCVHEIGLVAADRLGDRTAQAHAHRHLAGAYALEGRLDDSRAQLAAALTYFDELGDLANQARVHINLSQIFGQLQRHRDALHHSERALEIFQAVGDPVGQARALNAVGWDHAHLGDHGQALWFCQQALALHQRLGNRSGEAATWDSLGYTNDRLGDHAPAVACYLRALSLFEELGNRYQQAQTLCNLAEAQLAGGDSGSAGAAWRRALSILDELDHADAGRIRDRLAALRMPAAVSS